MSTGLAAFTLFHVGISLIGILSGLVVVGGMISARRLDGWTKVFLWTTLATSVTGFLFPFHKLTPGLVIGVLSLLLLALAFYGRYSRRLAGGWRRTYVITSVIALYFNSFILVVQMFEKLPALKVLAPTQSEAPFKFTQLGVLILFVVLGILGTRGFGGESVRAA